MEIARRLIQGLIGSNSKIYQFGAMILDFLYVAHKEGVRAWFSLRQLQRESLSDLSPIPVKLHTLQHPIFIRPGTEDVPTIINNIIREEYGNFQPVSDPRWMIDAGAYIGDTTAYFLSRFPKLNVIALEPNPPSHEMASRNLKPYNERAVVIKKALWVEDCNAFFEGDSTGASIQDRGFEIECISMPTIIKQFSIYRIDILKMDIEGAEKSIFASNPEEWLSRTNLLIIEIHGPEILSLVSTTLQRCNFSMKQYRSVWYCRPIQ